MNEIYSALITRLTSSTITYVDPLTDISFDNSDFNPKGKEAWLSCDFIPVERFTATKDQTGMTDTGFFQVTIYVPLNDKTGGIKQYNMRALEVMESLLSAFADNTTLTFINTNLFICGAEFAAPLISESWYSVPLTINYMRI